MIRLTIMLVLSLLTTFSTSRAEEAPSLRALLLSPGALSRSHQSLPGACDACHSNFSRDQQNALCIDCHSEIQQDLESRTRFHGLRSSTDCGRCHTEHKGMDAEITAMDEDLFDHSLTDFVLEGLHQSTDCADCHNDTHREGNEFNGYFRIESHDCASCHADPHDKTLGAQCDSCHAGDGWAVDEFDHTTTDYPLEEAHRNVPCAGCHHGAPATFAAPDQCQDCHGPGDVHRGAVGLDCDQCHTPTKWDISDFSHNDTNFRLTGTHDSLTCQVCHNESSKDLHRTLTESTHQRAPCKICHDTFDIHRGTYGDTCQTCHNDTNWTQISFDHNGATPFSILGRHKDLPCVACHTPGNAPSDTDRLECQNCHGADDVHRGELGTQCDGCHRVESAWRQTSFDHDFSLFPLTGLHRILPCFACHKTQDFKLELTKCDQCHGTDGHHEGIFLSECDTCHSTRSWHHWDFDHNTLTDFQLRGAHGELGCGSCHVATLPDPLAPGTACVDCHAGDDVHRSSFGQQCQDCHRETSFRDIVNRRAMNRRPIHPKGGTVESDPAP